METGTLVISLDFELMWGMIHSPHANEYKETHVKQVPEVIDRLLELFQKHGVHATFATVGFIGYKNPQELLSDIPKNTPTYTNSALNPYANDFIKNITESEYPLYFRPDLIEKIKNTPGMEIATHTFSHYYCWEDGQGIDHFDADIAKAKEKASKDGIELKSIIFPRNQVSISHLDICRKYDINVYRGNPRKFYKNKKGNFNKLARAACRLVDNYINISGSNSYTSSQIFEGSMKNVRASRFLRPYSPSLRFLEPLRLRRIKKEITRAAKRGEIYHLWWHPHNFGANVDQNINFLEKIINHYDHLLKLNMIKSQNMSEISTKQTKS